MNEKKIAIESNSFTYLLKAMHSSSCPVGDEAKEKIALLRLFFYLSGVFYITPTVEIEVGKIKNIDKLKNHESLFSVHLGITVTKDQSELDKLAKNYNTYHCGTKNLNDCKIVAEAELDDCHYLLSYDKNLVKNLADKTNTINIVFPSAYWEKLAIPKGTPPKWSPHPTNPLSKQSWHKW